MKELCSRLLENNTTNQETNYRICKRMMELGGLGFFECHDCQVVFRRQAQDERPLSFPTESK